MIGLGIGFLGQNYGLWDASIWRSIARVWPLLLIIIGIKLAFGWTRLSRLLMVVAGLAAIPLVIALAIQNKAEVTNRPANHTLTIGANNDVERIKFEFDIGAAKFYLSSLSDSDDFLEGHTQNTGPIEVDAQINNFEAIYEVKEKSGRWVYFSGGREFNYQLTPDLPVELDIKAGASDTSLNLEDLQVERLTVNAGASKLEIRLGNLVDRLEASLSIGAASLKLYVPADAGIQLNAEDGLSTQRFSGIEFERNGDVWSSDNFEAAAQKIIIDIDSGVSSIEIISY